MKVTYLRIRHCLSDCNVRKFLLSFFVPFSLVYFVCLTTFLGRADFSTFFVLLGQGLMYGLFSAVCAGWFGVAVVAIFPWVIRLFKLKSNMYLSSIGVVLVAFALGLHYSCLPESQKKYLMPKKHIVYLNAKKYKVWYYPRWGENFHDWRKLRQYSEELPTVTLTSKSGKCIQVEKSKSSGCCCMMRLAAINFGELQVSESGVYQLSADSAFDKHFVISLVPPDALNKHSMPNGPPFWGFDSEKLEQP